MNITPLPFLRLGFAILALGFGLAVFSGRTGLGGLPLIGASALAFLIVLGAGEVILRHVASRARTAERRVRSSRSDAA